MFIDEKRSGISRSSELSEMLGISLNSEENKIGVRASYKHFAAMRLFSRQTPPQAGGILIQRKQDTRVIQQGKSMSLKDQIIKDMTASMKAKDAARTSTLRMVKAALQNREIEKGGPLDDDELMKLLRSLVKQRRDSVEQYQKGGRQDLVDKEQAEIAVIESYLPQGASQAEIAQAVSEAIGETGATSMKDMGAVMKAVMTRLAGKNADGRMVSETVKSKLGG